MLNGKYGLGREVAIKLLPEEFHGRKLFYRNGDAVMALKEETDPVFKLGKPEVLFQGNMLLK